MIGVGQPPEDAHDNPARDDAADGLAELRARRDLPAELDRLRARVGELETLLEEERAQRRLLQEQLDQTERTIADVRTGAMELALRLTAEQDARHGGVPARTSFGTAPAAPVPPQDVAVPAVAPATTPPAAEDTGPVGEPAALDPQTANLIEGLQRAAERLRTQVGERDEEGEKAPDAEPAAPQPQEVAPDPEPEAQVAPDPELEAQAEPEPEPLPAVVLAPRRAQAGPRSPWLTAALDRLVAGDRDRGASAVAALVPAQAARSRRDLVYDLAVVGSGTWRVRLQDGIGTVGPLLGGPAADREIDFVVSGPPAALVPLGAGGARRRLPGTFVTGRRRRLRKLQRDLRAPLGLADLAAAQATVDPGLLLELLAGAVAPEWTAGHEFDVDYDVHGATGGRWHVVVDAGLRTGDGPCEDGAVATVRVADVALPALLAGLALPDGESATVTGAIEAVTLLHGWFDAAQGVSA